MIHHLGSIAMETLKYNNSVDISIVNMINITRKFFIILKVCEHHAKTKIKARADT